MNQAIIAFIGIGVLFIVWGVFLTVILRKPIYKKYDIKIMSDEEFGGKCPYKIPDCPIDNPSEKSMDTNNGKNASNHSMRKDINR